MDLWLKFVYVTLCNWNYNYKLRLFHQPKVPTSMRYIPTFKKNPFKSSLFGLQNDELKQIIDIKILNSTYKRRNITSFFSVTNIDENMIILCTERYRYISTDGQSETLSGEPRSCARAHAPARPTIDTAFHCLQQTLQ